MGFRVPAPVLENKGGGQSVGGDLGQLKCHEMRPRRDKFPVKPGQQYPKQGWTPDKLRDKYDGDVQKSWWHCSSSPE